MADVAAAGGAQPLVLGGSAGAGDFAGAAGAVDGPQLARLSQFEPLAPRYANDPDEFVPAGFDKWVRTWIADYVSTEDVYWQVPGDDVDFSMLPSRAFDNRRGVRSRRRPSSTIMPSPDFVGPELNDRFMALANERIRASPASLLRLAAGAAHRRHVAAPANRDAAAELALVGIC